MALACGRFPKRRSPDSERRVRYLIARHFFPAFMRGGRLYARAKDIERYYSLKTDKAA